MTEAKKLAEKMGDASDSLRPYAEAILKAQEALTAIKLEPYGCSRCDSGALRIGVPGHQDDCPFVLLESALAALRRWP